MVARFRVVQWTAVANDSPARSPGRPRDTTLDTAILNAAARHLGERGYAGMSMEGVAAAGDSTAPNSPTF